jgi:GrpB-like predicted nucleotidyltransferase (UPF0157 family)
MQIVLAPYNPEWPSEFENEKNRIGTVLSPEWAVVEHIGSTSVPGLAAKPVIDILVGLRDFDRAMEAVDSLESIGYAYLPQYEDTMPYRRLLILEEENKRSVNLHMVAIDTEFWERHLRFRDYLRSHPEVRDAYNQLKTDLAQKDWASVNDYAQAKTEFIRRVEAQAKLS